MNGSYSDYVREFTRVPAMAMPNYMPPGYPPMDHHSTAAHYAAYDSRAQHRDYGAHLQYMPPTSRGGRPESKRSYEEDVNDFLRRTAPARARDGREGRRDRDRSRERERHRDSHRR